MTLFSPHTPRQAAFTLVELSIVLVILGLLVGGIMAGQALIRGAELNAIHTEADKYKTAVHNFRDKYSAYPGDLATAHDYWLDDCGDNDATISTGCNGNGNGIIEFNGGENIKVWEHLRRAGMIEGSYDGTGTVVGNNVELTPANSPASKFNGGYWEMSEIVGDAVGAAAALYLRLGSLSTPPSIVQGNLLGMRLDEAWNIDNKIDDGRANTGLLRGTSASACQDTGTDFYSLTAAGAETIDQCKLHFILQQLD